MARTNNLTDFLTDVSSAIKQKTGDSAPIPASEFDTEILSIETAGNYQSKTLNITQNGNYNLLPDQEFDAISNVNISVSVSPVLQNKTITENGSYTADQNYDGLGTVIVNVPSTGIDTSDATAAADDILAPKTAYVNGNKVEGAIITDYKSSEMTNEKLAYSVSNNNCCGISPDGKYIVTTSGSNIYIYERTGSSDNNLISTTSMSDIGISNSSIYQICVSYTYITGNKCYVAFRTGGTTQTIFVTTLDFDTFKWTTAYSLPTVTANYNGGAMCFAKYTSNIIAVLGRNGHLGNGCIYRLTENSYTSVSTFSLSNQDRTGDLEFQGHDKFLVANHTHHWDGHSSGYMKLSSTFAVLATVNTGENNYVFYNNSNKVVIIASAGTTISYGTYTDNGSSITLGTLTTVNISMNCCVGYIDADDEVIYSYGKTNKIQAYSLKDNSFTKLGECAATGYFDLGQPYRIAFSNTNNIILCSMGTSLINGIITDKSGKYLAAMTRIGVTYYNTNDSTATKADLLENKIVYNSEGKVIGTMPNNGAQVYVPGDSVLAISDGYHKGSTISAVDITTLNDYAICEAIADNILGDTKPYVELEYVQSTGTQWIDTGYIPNDNTKYEITLSDVDGSRESTIFGTGAYSPSQHLLVAQFNNIRWYYPRGNFVNITTDTTTKCTITLYRGTTTYNGTTVSSSTTTNGTTNTTNLYICKCTGSSAYASYKLYRFKVYENNVLVRDFIPVKDLAGKACLYDLVENKFYYSTTDFIAGGVI